ncbi:hypothetical protein [Nocardia brasiliensis]|uniref:hypothetical protein n=1 Tax=Nocardia brasiliensis TaxID=37326 RepID=UPI001892E47B|nr:hypothetical protein [Nocardia brasiliensis]MBF6541963.1 hypothetical protein [Nocardia brasiliensis]
MTFEVNGYRLHELRKDPAVVEDALTALDKLLSATRAHMAHLGRHDLADRLAELSRRLHASGVAIDDAFDRDFRELSGECATVCIDAGTPPGLRDRSGQIYRDLAWGIVEVVTIRIGGVGTIAHPGNGPG